MFTCIVQYTTFLTCLYPNHIYLNLYHVFLIFLTWVSGLLHCDSFIHEYAHFIFQSLYVLIKVDSPGSAECPLHQIIQISLDFSETSSSSSLMEQQYSNPLLDNSVGDPYTINLDYLTRLEFLNLTS